MINSISLDACPHIRHVGVGQHGHLPRETFCVDAWCLMLMRYRGALEVEGRLQPFAFASILLTPPRMDLNLHFYEKDCRHVYILFHPADGGNEQQFTVHIDASAIYHQIAPLIDSLVALHARNPAHANARFWDVLWQLANLMAVRTKGSVQNKVVTWMDWIENHLSESIHVEDIARETGYSRSHVNRLFREATGVSVKQFITQRRMQRALSLLRNTQHSIKWIARECGIPDAQHFNKLCRKHLGHAPSILRRNGGAAQA